MIVYNKMLSSEEVTIEKYINKTTVKKVTYLKRDIKTRTKSTTTKTINYREVIHNDNKYVVCYTPYLDKHILFIIDEDDKDKVINRSWHYQTTGKYVSNTQYDEYGGKHESYLHNLVMNKLTFEGKGQQHTVDHINRIGTDNRKENLRMVTSQSAQNFNQKKKQRKIELPPDSGLTADMIPRCVWYMKPSGKHADGFCIEIKGVPSVGDGNYTWKTTRSTKYSLQTKLNEAIIKLNELKQVHPELEHIVISREDEQRRNTLIESYNDILLKSGFPKSVIDANLHSFETELIDRPAIEDDVEVLRGRGRNLSDCDVTKDMIPKYVYYIKATESRGDKFTIDRHPALIAQGRRQWSTPENKSLTTKQKFDLMMIKYNELSAVV